MDDLEYFRRRLLEEEAAARGASCREARVRHEELASAYRLRSRLAVAKPPVAAGLGTSENQAF